MPDVSRTLIHPEGRSVSVSKALESQKDSGDRRDGARREKVLVQNSGNVERYPHSYFMPTCQILINSTKSITNEKQGSKIITSLNVQ